jgi:hypothetical protein
MNASELTYLAMRAGPIDASALRIRAGGISHANKMVRIGHATVSTDGQNPVYRITNEGRAACPSRRTIEKEIVEIYPGVMA